MKQNRGRRQAKQDIATRPLYRNSLRYNLSSVPIVKEGWTYYDIIPKLLACFTALVISKGTVGQSYSTTIVC